MKISGQSKGNINFRLLYIADGQLKAEIRNWGNSKFLGFKFGDLGSGERQTVVVVD